MPRSVGDLLVGRAAHEHEEHFELARGQSGRQLTGSLPDPVAGGGEHRVDSFWVEPSLCASRINSASAAGASSAALYGRASRMAV